MLQDDATGALQTFLEGLNEVEKTQLTPVLEELGIQGERDIQVIGTLAGANELLADKLGLAAKEAEKKTALDREAELASQSLGARLDILRNTWDAVILTMRESNGTMADVVDFTSQTIAVLFSLEGAN